MQLKSFDFYFLFVSETCMLFLQGTLTAIRDWFRDYKIPDGKPANEFGLGNKAASKVNWAWLSSSLSSNPLFKHLT